MVCFACNTKRDPAWKTSRSLRSQTILDADETLRTHVPKRPIPHGGGSWWGSHRSGVNTYGRLPGSNQDLGPRPGSSSLILKLESLRIESSSRLGPKILAWSNFDLRSASCAKEFRTGCGLVAGTHNLGLSQ